MIYRQKKTIHIVITFLIVSLVLFVISTFIEIPYQINTYAEVFPKERWLITRGNGGQVISNLVDYFQGHTAQYNVAQFERGEFVSVSFNQHVFNKKEFSKGDTILTVLSSNVTDQLVSAENELEVALATLKSQSSGEKEPLIREAENRLKYTEEKIAEQKILYDRAKQLLEKDYSSQQEFELQKWALNLLEIERRIYSAQVENLQTGVKSEEVLLLESQIMAAENRLKFLKEWKSQLVLVSPIQGKVINSFSPDTLLNAVNYDQIVLYTPIKFHDLPEFKEGQKVQVSFSNYDEIYNGQVIRINKEIKFMNGQQVAFISVILDNPKYEFLPGLIVEGSLRLSNITLFSYIIRLITN